MHPRLLSAALLLAGLAAPVHASEPGAEQRAIAQRGLQILYAVHQRNGSQQSAMRRCRAYMEEAVSAHKLGATAAAARNWDRAARGCNADALVACRGYRSEAPAEQCNMLLR